MDDPIATLMQEHQRFLERLRSFRSEVRSAAGRAVAPTDLARRVLGFAAFLDEEVNRFHGRKEEEGLFPVLGRHIPVEAGPIGVMLAEHQLLGEQHGVLFRNGQKVEADAAAVEALGAIEASSRTVESLLTSHIDKEDHVLFPMARETLSPSEMAEVAEVCRRIEDERSG